MSCETKTEKINGATYVCTQYNATTGLLFKMELVQVLSPVLQEIAPALFDRSLSTDNQTEILLSSLQKVFSTTTPEKIVDLIKRMLTGGSLIRDGQRMTPALFEQVYSGDDLLDVYRTLAFVIRVNYANLIGGQKLGELLAENQSPSTQNDSPI